MSEKEFHEIVAEAKNQGKDAPTRRLLVIFSLLAVAGVLVTLTSFWYAWSTGRAVLCPTGFLRETTQVESVDREKPVTLYVCVQKEESK